jgi:hypothetical protein
VYFQHLTIHPAIGLSLTWSPLVTHNCVTLLCPCPALAVTYFCVNLLETRVSAVRIEPRYLESVASHSEDDSHKSPSTLLSWTFLVVLLCPGGGMWNVECGQNAERTLPHNVQSIVTLATQHFLHAWQCR